MIPKPLASLLAAFLLLSMMSGCGAENIADPITTNPPTSETEAKSEQSTMSELSASAPTTGTPAYPEVTEHTGVTYAVSTTLTDITPTGATVNFYRKEEKKPVGELFTGEWFALEYCTNEGEPFLTWETLPTKGDYDWRSVAYSVPAQNRTMLTLDWSTLYRALDPGAYRLVTVLYERTSEGELYGKYYYLPFRITEEPFSGYGLALTDVPAEKMPSSDPIVKGDFRMTAEEVTPRGATLRFSHEIIGGYSYYLERYDGETWVRVPYLPRDIIDFAFPEVAIVMRETHAVDWSSHYGELEPGVYRIAKDMGSWEYNADYFAYFEITE